ncbi:MAG: hypothetical protein WAW37_02180 [Syntrophobacteraceae bacterium]
MKQYVFDQLRENDYHQIHEFLKNNAEETVLSEIFWLPVPENLYSHTQKEHSECHPFYFAVNLSRNRVDFELLIRSRQMLRCNCIRYADREQRDYILDYADKMLADLKIRL